MIPWIVIAGCAVAAVELVARLPLGTRTAALRDTLARVAAATGSSASDHWKQRALTVLSRRMFVHSMALSLLLLVGLAPFLAAIPLSAAAGHDILQPVASVGGMAVASTCAAVYATCRARLVR